MAAVKVLRASLFREISKKCNVLRSSHSLTNAKYAQTLLNIPETNVTELGNGLRVASSQTDSPTSTVGLWIEAGSRHESSETNGVANLFEHLMFKGTQQKSRQQLEKEIHDMGAQFHANTGRELTSIFAKCLSGDVSKAVEILGGIIQNKDFEEAEIEKARNAILSELEEIQVSDLREVTFDYLHHTAYQGTPLERSVYGPTESIKKLTKTDIIEYTNNIVGPRVVLAGNGNIKHDELVKLAEKHLGSLSNHAGKVTPVTHCRYTGSDVRARDDWLPFAHVAIAVNTEGADSPDVIPLALAKNIVGTWDKTLLSSADTTTVMVQNIYKEKRCHSFESFHTLYSDTGLWGCHFVADGMVLDDFMWNLQNEWVKLCVNISEPLLTIAKNKLRNELLGKFNDTTLKCNEIGQQVLYLGKVRPFAEIEEEIEAVSINDLRNVCSKYIYDKCPAVSAVGPIEGLTDYLRIRGNMYTLLL